MTIGTPGGQGHAASAAILPAACSVGTRTLPRVSAARGGIAMDGSTVSPAGSDIGARTGKRSIARRSTAISRSLLNGVTEQDGKRRFVGIILLEPTG